MQPTLSGGHHGGQWGTKWSIKDSAAILCAHIIIPNAGQPLHLPLTERNICYGLFVAARSIYLCIAISLLLVRYLAETNEVKEPPRSKSRRRKLWKLHLCKNQDIWSSVNRDPEKSEIAKVRRELKTHESAWYHFWSMLVGEDACINNLKVSKKEKSRWDRRWVGPCRKWTNRTYMMLSMPCLKSLSRSSSLEVETPRRGELGRWLVSTPVTAAAAVREKTTLDVGKNHL